MNKELEKDLNNILNQQMKYDNPKTVSQDKWDSLNNIKQALQDKDEQIKDLQELNKGHQKTIELLTNERDIAFDKLNKIKEVDERLDKMEWTSRQSRALRYEKEVKLILESE